MGHRVRVSTKREIIIRVVVENDSKIVEDFFERCEEDDSVLGTCELLNAPIIEEVGFNPFPQIPIAGYVDVNPDIDVEGKVTVNTDLQ